MNASAPTPIAYEGSVGEYLAEYFQPGDAFTVFDGQPCLENDITFDTDGEPNFDVLLNGHGTYTIIETPSGAVGVQILIAVIIAVIVIALTPKPKFPNNVSRSQESPNNRLTSRSNVARPLERIPDIKGSIRAIPDVIQPTYSTYEDNKEIEHGYYCVGRKQYLVEEVNDGDTPIDLITQASAGVYFPNNSPNLGAPDVAINGHVSEPLLIPYRANSVNGIFIEVAEANPEISGSLLVFDDLGGVSGSIRRASEFWNQDVYKVGENIILTGVNINEPPVQDLSGTFEITSIVEDTMTVTGVPWSFSGIHLGISGFATAETTPTEINTDYFYVTRAPADFALINIVAPNGMFQDDGTNFITRTVDFEIDLEGVDKNGNPSGNVETIEGSISGNSSKLRSVTIQHTFANQQRFRMRARRITPEFSGTGIAVDQISIEDLYGMQDVSITDFGDVTTIQTRTVATPFATAVKERQLNCRATELLNVYEGGGVFNGSLTPNTRGIQSFITDAIDPVIGNRVIDEIDADALLLLDAEIDDYFIITQPGRFNYTFDSTDISFQDYTQIIFNAIFCIAFREAGKISALLERDQSTPSMLFTHRSKRPGSETHTRNFNPSTINDGVEFTYVDQDLRASETIYIPENKTAVNPKKYDIPGIQDRKQALIRARREFNKLFFSKISLDLTVTAEGRYIRPNDMISVVKGTRVQTFDGEILEQDGLTLTLSQDVVFDVGVHSIVLKDENGETEAIEVTAGINTDQVILAGAPTQTIRTGIDSRRTEFSFGSESRHLAERWLTQEIDITDKWFVNLKAINYSDDYYSDDLTPVRAFSNGFSGGFG